MGQPEPPRQIGIRRTRDFDALDILGQRHIHGAKLGNDVTAAHDKAQHAVTLDLIEPMRQHQGLFTKLASSRDTDQLLAMLPYKSLHLSSVKDRFGIYALVGKNENRDKGICKPRTSVRKQLSETKQAASPKKAAARSKQHEMEV